MNEWQGATPLISVIMASYGHAAFIAEAIKSVQAQTYTNWQLIIVDDGSPDGSLNIVQSHIATDKRISCYTHSANSNKGLPATLTLGLKKATGEYIAFLESDDIWHPTSLQKRLETLQKTKLLAVVNDISLLVMGVQTEWHVRYLRRITAERIKAVAECEKQKIPIGLNFGESILFENKIPTFSSVMLEAKLLKSCDLVGTPVKRWTDWWLWYQISSAKTFAYVPEELTIWRLHGESFNHSFSTSEHLVDSAKIWAGFRRLCKKDNLPCSFKRKLILTLPFWCRIVVRAILLFKNEGLYGGWKAVQRRLS